MIQITNKQHCTACEACVQVCPKHCISFEEDNEGFRYPLVNQSLCIDCGLCEMVCPVLHQGKAGVPVAIYGAKNRNEDVRRQSSSGGVFTLLAEKIISEGGVVFGAKFNSEWDVVHDFTETIEELAPFRTSKYVQSRIGNTFEQVKEFLCAGRKVLFTGTPCQVAGLNLFLRKKYDKLLTVDFICHGAPSPKVWRLYKAELLAGFSKNTVSFQETAFFTAINFRDKQMGWKKFSFAALVRCANKNSVLRRSIFNENIYMRGFLRDLYLRPSCHACPAKSLKSGSDITIADFWGIEKLHPEFDDDRGTSLVIINSDKGESSYNSLSLESISTTEQALQNVLFFSVKPHSKREKFFQKLDKSPSLTKLIERETRISIIKQIIVLGKRIVKKLLRMLIR